MTLLSITNSLGGGSRVFLEEFGRVVSIHPLECPNVNDFIGYDTSSITGIFINQLYLYVRRPKEYLARLRHLFPHLPFSVCLHDFYLLLGTLLTSQEGLEHELCRLEGDPKEREYRREVFHHFTHILCPSYFVRDTLLRIFPELRERCEVRYHRHIDLTHSVPIHQKPRGVGDPLQLLCFGDFRVKGKGAEVALRVAQTYSKKIQLHVMGHHMYGDKEKEAFASCTGPYTDTSLLKEIQKRDPHAILFVNTVPETFCYAMHTAIESRRPIIAPAIGSFPEMLQGRPHTYLYHNNIDDILYQHYGPTH